MNIILHITPSLMIGGAESFLVSLLQNFKHKSHSRLEHQVAYYHEGPNLNRLHQLGIQTHQIKNHLISPIGIWELYNLVQKIQPNALHSMLWSANFSARLIGKVLKIPTICAIHSEYNSGHINYDHPLKKWIDQKSLNWATKIVTIAPTIYNKFLDPKFKLKKQQLITIINGISPKTKHLYQKTTSVHFTIGHVGRLVPIKNQALLIQTLPIIRSVVPNIRLIIVGYGELEHKLKQLTHKYQVADIVTFHNSNNPEQFYHQFDCFVLPSHSEGLSIALLEAMSHGLVPIVTSTKQHPVVRHKQNGLISQPNHAEELARNLVTIAQNQSLRQQLQTGALWTISQKFNLNRTSKEYLKVYQSII